MKAHCDSPFIAASHPCHVCRAIEGHTLCIPSPWATYDGHSLSPFPLEKASLVCGLLFLAPQRDVIYRFESMTLLS